MLLYSVASKPCVTTVYDSGKVWIWKFWGTRRISQGISQALLEVMGYNRKTQEYHDGVSLRSGKNENTWARHLGIQILLVSFQSLTLVEPSEIAQSDLEFVAVGEEKAAIHRALREKY
jgi:hypothetical protein